MPALHKLPTDRPRPLELQGRGAVLKHTLSRAVAEALSQLCRRHGFTPYMVGIAAFAVLLHRYSGESDIVIGSPFANRPTEAQQRLIGFFINLIPLRFRFEQGITFLALLTQARNTLLDAFENSDLPFDEIVDAVQPLRSLSHAPLFQVMFDYLKSPVRNLELDGLDVTAGFLHSGTAKYDLTLSLEESAGELAGIFEFDTDLFDQSTVARLARHFEQLLANLLAAPQGEVAHCSLLPPEELARIRQFARPAAALPALEFMPVAERIEAHALANPQAEAIVYRERRISYGELRSQARRIGARLCERGVVPGSRVAVLMSYKPEIVVAFFAILRAGANAVVRRHAALRTTFSASVRTQREADGTLSFEPVRQLADELELKLRAVDLTGRAGELARRLREEAMQGFDLNRGPLLRAALFALGAEEHVLCLTLHHIIADGRSLVIFMQELQAFYNARLNGTEAGLPRLESGYDDFVAWQRDLLLQPSSERQLAFWKQRLQGLPAVLQLEQPPPAGAALAPAAPEACVCTIPRPQAEKLERLARRCNSTPFMVYFSLFALLLRRHSGRTDIVAGTPVSQRSTPAFDALIGFFANTLPVRVETAGAASFRELLALTRAACLEVFEHREIPFDHLVQELNPARVAGKNPIFQVIFSCELDAAAPLRMEGLEAAEVPLDTYSAKLDLELAVTRTNGEVFAHFMATPGTLAASTLEAMCDHYQHMLIRAVETPDIALNTLLVPGGSRTALPPAPARPPEAGATLYTLFAGRVAGCGDQVALEGEGLALTYRQLDELTARAARSLQRLGIGRGDRVGVFMGRHPHNATAMLAIARAGAAFVPLDPELNRRGNEYIAADAGLCALVCRGGVTRNNFHTYDVEEAPEPPVAHDPRHNCYDNERDVPGAGPMARVNRNILTRINYHT